MIRLIAVNTLEWIRLKFIHIILFLAFGYYALSYLLGSLSFTEQERIFFDFGLGGIEVATVFVAAFLSTHALHREIERKTILVLLARPIPRWQLLLGYLGGLSILNFFVVLILGGVLYFALEESSHYGFNLFVSLFIIFYKSLVISAFGLLCSVLARPMFGFVLTLAFWIAAYSIPDIIFLAQKLKNESLIFFTKILNIIIPNFYIFNWKNFQFLRVDFVVNDLLWAIFHCTSWITILIFFASIAFRRKEIV
jgi:Cu-processing system permease protein